MASASWGLDTNPVINQRKVTDAVQTEVARLTEFVQVMRLAAIFPHCRVTIEIADSRVVRVEVAPRFVGMDLKPPK